MKMHEYLSTKDFEGTITRSNSENTFIDIQQVDSSPKEPNKKASPQGGKQRKCGPLMVVGNSNICSACIIS